MFGFNVNQPLDDPRMIAATIGGYETPEAAESDFRNNAPRGMQYLTNQYQRLSGDAFADPFEDAKKQRSEAMVRAAMGGASVATGSNAGMQLLGTPEVAVPSISTAAAPLSRPVATLQQPTNSPPVASALLPTPMRDNDRELRSEALRNMLQSQGREYQLARKDLEIPTPTANNYLDVLEKRSNLLGTANEFKEIWRNNPKAFMTPTDETDPRFSRTQAGKAVGMDIHPLAYDDTFQQLARRDPVKAAALYRATTNRNYDTDIKAKSQLLVEQRGDRRKIIEGIKGLEADPVTGDLFKVVERTDPLGQVQRQRVPISPLEKAAIDAEGGTKRIYGIDLPGRGGLPKLPGMTNDEMVQYRSKTQQLMKEKGLDVQSASALAHRMMYSDQQARNTPTTTTSQRPGMQRWGEALTDTNISTLNFPIKMANELLSAPHLNLGLGQDPIPLIPHPDWNELQRNDVPVSDVLREMVNYAQGRPAGRTYSNQPILPTPPLAVARRR